MCPFFQSLRGGAGRGRSFSPDSGGNRESCAVNHTSPCRIARKRHIVNVPVPQFQDEQHFGVVKVPQFMKDIVCFFVLPINEEIMKVVQTNMQVGVKLTGTQLAAFETTLDESENPIENHVQ